MSRTGRRVVLLTACALLAGVATVKAFGGFGERGPTRTITTTVPATVADVPVADAGPLPALPRGWRRVQDPRGGFSVGLPPGWSARRSGGTLVLRSRDRTLAIAVGADRSAPGRVAEPATYADQAIESLRGYRGLRSSDSRPLRTSPYPGAQATATGTYADTGVEQAITLVALQRRGDATYTLLAFRSAQSPREPARRVVARVVDTLHSERPA
ncbi:hypothetical protein Q5424_04635 [Conexibacter sp. JD483]|uniref:hypothetical protein n=1 Tax=unclassified Conexibacter TaxID=2627773 RepID=UPI002726FD81|nr:MULTISPECIES: hypothetical protein [unclassified Conexibacter]MDO8184385.1 hypothetical protein [Conexibacter sp. CPCC 205706]MDO8197691.1 hypothetical protein [Conexibacter sp. CPCC 205762]MDR9368354.1 hypothetical protein [Conexibacter sp. JD483]